MFDLYIFKQEIKVLHIQTTQLQAMNYCQGSMEHLIDKERKNIAHLYQDARQTKMKETVVMNAYKV